MLRNHFTALLVTLFLSCSSVSSFLLAAQSSLPDLNLLKDRVEGYWSLLQEDRRMEALEYVLPETRDDFLTRRGMRFSSFIFRGITFGEDPLRIRVQVDARVGPPYLPQAVDWPVHETYVFQKGTWFLEALPSQAKGLFGIPGSTSEPVPLSQEERQAIQNELDRFQFSRWHLELGQLQQGHRFREELSYRNEGTADLLVEIGEPPPWMAFGNKPQFQLSPGEEGVLPVLIDTTELDGPVSGRVPVRIRSGTEETKRDLTVAGLVTAPLTITPWPVVLGEGQTSQEIQLHNNLEEEIRIRAIIPSHRFLKMIGRSFRDELIIPPGQSARLEMAWDPAELPKAWRSGSLQLTRGGLTFFIPIRREVP